MARNADDFPSSYSGVLSHLNFSGPARKKKRRFYHVCPLDAVRVNGAIWKSGLQSKVTRNLRGRGWFDNGEGVYVGNSQESCLLQNVGARKHKPGLVVVDISYDNILRVHKKGKTGTGVQSRALIALGRSVSELHVVPQHPAFLIRRYSRNYVKGKGCDAVHKKWPAGHEEWAFFEMASAHYVYMGHPGGFINDNKVKSPPETEWMRPMLRAA